MRLLFLSNFYPPCDRGGLESLCQEVADGLRKRDHFVWVLSSKCDKLSVSNKSANAIYSLYIQAGINYYRPLDFFMERRFNERANGQALRNALDQLSPDLVVVWGMWNLSRYLPFWAEQWMPGRVAYYVSDTWPIDMDIHENYWRLPARHRTSELIKKLLRFLALRQLRREGYPPPLYFQHAVCCSQYIRDMLVDGGKLPESTGVLYHGIDPVQFLREVPDQTVMQERPLRLVYFGRLASIKGVHTAIEAVGILRQRGLANHIDLTILGSGHPDYEAYLRTKAMELDVGSCVHFVGRVHWDALLSHLKSSDIFLFTSTGREAMARTVMEAMAAGLLVVGTQAGGQKEMLFDGENALVFQAGDATSLADCIARVINEPSMRWRLALAGQQMILERFTLKRMVDDVEKWLQAIGR